MHLDKAMNGYNTTIMVYGVTGAGKTHTIFGNLASSGEEEGLLQQSVRRVLEGDDTEISVSYLEIYNENVNDLLNSNHALTIMEDGDGTLNIPNLRKIGVEKLEDFVKLIVGGNRLRKMGRTKVNEFSSRSHAIVQVHIKRKITISGVANMESFVESKLSFVDLAGSERMGDSRGKVVVEGSNINRSLLALGKVISKLSSQDTRQNKLKAMRRERSARSINPSDQLAHLMKLPLKFNDTYRDSLGISKRHNLRESTEVFIPYRDSKLTRLLKDSLGGNTKTILITCITPSEGQLEETVHSLNYAARAKKIKNRVKKNEFFETDRTLRKERLKESELKLALNRMREKNGKLEKENTELKKDYKKEKAGRDEAIRLYMEVVKAVEQQYELKASIEELKKIQEINIQKIDQKKLSLKKINDTIKSPQSKKDQMKSDNSKVKLESEIRSLVSIIEENDQIMKEMNNRLKRMEDKLGNWIQSCPKKFKNYSRKKSLQKSGIYDTESSGESSLDSSNVDLNINHPSESRDDDDIFIRKIDTEVEKPGRRKRDKKAPPKLIDYKAPGSKISFPLRAPIKSSKGTISSRVKMLKENSKPNQGRKKSEQPKIHSRRNEKGICYNLRTSLNKLTYHSRYAERNSLNPPRSNKGSIVPLGDKRVENSAIDRKHLSNGVKERVRKSKSRSKNTSGPMGNYRSLRTGLGATEETFGVRKIDSLLARFDKENEIRKNKRKYIKKNGKGSMGNLHRSNKPSSMVAYSTRNSRALRRNKMKILAKDTKKRQEEVSRRERADYNSLMDVQKVDESMELNQDSMMLNNMTMVQDDNDAFKLQLVEVKSTDGGNNNQILKNMMKKDSKKKERAPIAKDDIKNSSYFKANELARSRDKLVKEYRSNQNSSSKTKLFQTAEKVRRSRAERPCIRSSDKYKESRSSRKKMKMILERSTKKGPVLLSSEKTSKKFRKRLFGASKRLDESKKQETLAFSNSKLSDDNLSFLTHNIGLNRRSTYRRSMNFENLQTEFDSCLVNSQLSDVKDFENKQNLIFSSLKKSKMSKKLSKARQIKKRMRKISSFLTKNSNVVIEEKHVNIYLKLKSIFEQLQEEFFNFNESEKITFGEVEKFLKDFKKKNEELIGKVEGKGQSVIQNDIDLEI